MIERQILESLDYGRPFEGRGQLLRIPPWQVEELSSFLQTPLSDSCFQQLPPVVAEAVEGTAG